MGPAMSLHISAGGGPCCALFHVLEYLQTARVGHSACLRGSLPRSASPRTADLICICVSLQKYMHRLHILRGKFRLSKSGRSITTGNALDSSFRMEFHSEKYPFLVLPITAAFFVFLQEAELRGFMLTLTSEATSFRRNWQSHEIPHPATRFWPGPLLPPKPFYSSTLSTRPIPI